MTAPSKELVVDGAVLPLTKVAYTAFDQGRIDLIKNAKGAGAPLPVFYAFLELSARYDLDPMTGEIWLATMPGKNGGPGRHVVMVGRDGYLKVADRDPAFVDVDADVVYSTDEFRVTRKADGTRSVEHSYGNPAERGECVGAYAVLRREGKPDRYFFAPLAQYAKNPDKTAWSYRDAMVIKCAVSYITRLTYRISGPVPADEINGGLALADGQGNAIEGLARDVVDPPVMPPEIASLVARAAAVDPQSWRENEVAARVPDPDDRGYEAAVKQIVGELVAWLTENEPADADVIPDAPEGVEVPRQLQQRWDTDADWRGQVEPLLSRYLTVETALDQAIAEQEGVEREDELRTALAAVADDLDALGVPLGWEPDRLGGTATGDEL